MTGRLSFPCGLFSLAHDVVIDYGVCWRSFWASHWAIFMWRYI